MASAGWWTRLKENMGLREEEPEPPTLLQQIDEATTLSRTQVLSSPHLKQSLAKSAQVPDSCGTLLDRDNTASALEAEQCFWSAYPAPADVRRYCFYSRLATRQRLRVHLDLQSG